MDRRSIRTFHDRRRYRVVCPDLSLKRPPFSFRSMDVTALVTRVRDHYVGQF